MRKLVIDFRVNYQNCDYDAKLMFKCDSVNDLETAQASISDFLANKISEEKEGAE